ncbi:MAG: ErfK/YbiS/YcfS/YnhG family protein [Acidobacteria bacterium]|nr:ErfK/YbiS/YcfS/YnhG family protein [Acidobacteriota bacterium]
MDRRRDSRPGPRERRSFPRPPLWLNLLLLIIAAVAFFYARHQRDEIRQKTAYLFQPTPMNPAELTRIRQELADMDVTKAQLAKELDSRMQYVESLKGEQFYIAIDTQKKKLYLRLGKEIVRDADVQIGEPKTIAGANGKSWTFVPLKGGFNVTGKEEGYAWQVPEWAYAMTNQPVPISRPTVPNGLGRYVISLPNSYVIHSPPPVGSPLQGMPKPGSFMVPEADLAAIWPRVTQNTRVYIF